MSMLTKSQTDALTLQHGKRLAIFGSRSIGCERVAQVIVDAVYAMKPCAIVTAGEPVGVCEVARHSARAMSLPLHLHFLDVNKRAAGAWHWRSVAVYENADFVLLIHDGKSKGTANEMAVAIKMKLSFAYVKCEVDASDVIP
jgi:hypothetical protein